MVMNKNILQILSKMNFCKHNFRWLKPFIYHNSKRFNNKCDVNICKLINQIPKVLKKTVVIVNMELDK